jgi:DNA-binding protein H-NS
VGSEWQIRCTGSQQFDRGEHIRRGNLMIGLIVLAPRVLASRVLTPCILSLLVSIPAVSLAQDVPGIEICTAEKAMDRRTSCLQSNINFLQTTIKKLSLDHEQKIDAAKAQIEALKASVVSLQKIVNDLQASQKRTAEDVNKAQPAARETPPAKDAPPKDAPASKQGAK